MPARLQGVETGQQALAGKLSAPCAPLEDTVLRSTGGRASKLTWRGQACLSLPTGAGLCAGRQGTRPLCAADEGSVREAAAGISRKQVRICLDHRWWRWRCCGLVERPREIGSEQEHSPWDVDSLSVLLLQKVFKSDSVPGRVEF